MQNSPQVKNTKGQYKLQEMTANYHIYCRILQQLLYKYDSRPGYILNRIGPFRQQWLFCPTFRKHLHEIVNPQTLIKVKIYKQVIQELVNIIQIELRKIQMDLTEKERQQYECIARQNEKILQKKQSKRSKKLASQYQLSIRKMLKLDFLSLFLRLNMKYKRKYNMHVLIIPHKTFCKIFDIDTIQVQDYSIRIDENSSVITYKYEEQLIDIVLCFFITEVKMKMSNFRARLNKANFQKLKENQAKQQKTQFKSTQQLFEQSQFPLAKVYKFRFCQIAYVPQENRSSEKARQRYVFESRQIIKTIININNPTKQKREIIKLKLKFNIPILQLFQYYEEQKKQFFGKQPEDNESLGEFKNIQWGFLNNENLAQRIRQILKQNKIPIWTFYTKSNPLLIKLCQTAMERFGLLTTVLTAHKKIGLILQRRTVYICKFQYSFSDFINQKGTKHENDPKLTLILATTNSQILCAIIYQRILSDRQFGQIIKKNFNKIRFDKTNIIIYNLRYASGYDFKFLKRLLAILSYGDVQLYFDTSPQMFHIHFMVYFLIKSLMKMHPFTKETFAKVFEDSASKVLKAVHSSVNSRQILFSNPSTETQNIKEYQHFHMAFKKQVIEQKIIKAYRLLCQQMFQLQTNESLWNVSEDVLYGGRAFYFSRHSINDQKDEPIIDITQEMALNIKLVVNQPLFVDEYVQEMKCRHPYLNSEQYISIQDNLQEFIKERRMSLNDFKLLLKGVVRYLLCYQIYFNQMLLNNELEVKAAELEKQVHFLKKVYSKQTRKINQLYLNEIQLISKRLFLLQFSTGKRTKNDWNKCQEEPLVKQQDQSDQSYENQSRQQLLWRRMKEIQVKKEQESHKQQQESHKKQQESQRQQKVYQKQQQFSLKALKTLKKNESI